MKKLVVIGALAALALLSTVGLALAGDGPANRGEGGRLHAKLIGYEEVPAISTTAHGSFEALVNFEQDEIRYRLTYSGLTSPALASHIHLGQRGVNGGVFAFLCGGSTKPACPASGTVSGTIRAADVVAVPAQGIAAGELDEVIRALRHGVVYANVHTMPFPGGEIRGQVEHGRKHRFGRDGDKQDEQEHARKK